MLGISRKESRIKKGSTTVDTCIIEARVCCRKDFNIVGFEYLSGKPVTRRANASGDSTWIESRGSRNVYVRIKAERLAKYG